MLMDRIYQLAILALRLSITRRDSRKNPPLSVPGLQQWVDEARLHCGGPVCQSGPEPAPDGGS